MKKNFHIVCLAFFSVLWKPVIAQEYINETFTAWKNAGSGTSVWADGTQESVCFDDSTRTYSFKQCIVNNADVPPINSCTSGSILIRNSNNGILTLPTLPNVGLIMIAREGKEVIKNCKLRLQVNNNGTWVDVERDSVKALSGCEIYSFHYRSETRVQLRFQLEGNSATHLYWLYIEGTKEIGSRTPYIPDENLPLPDESKVVLLNDHADSIAYETLVGTSSYGWDPVNNGIYINWHRDFPNQINNSSDGTFDVRDTPTRHDSQNDVRALQHYYWYKYLHPESTYFDQAIKRLLPKVKSQYAHPSLLKGWLYYVLLRIYEYTDNPDDKQFWQDAILYWADNIYNTIDPTLGVFIQENMGNCDCGTSTIYLDKAYRVDYQLHSGAALVDAGTRFNKPEWVAAGYKQVLTTFDQCFVPQYNLFGRIFLVGNKGWKKDANGVITNNYDYSAFQNKLWDGQCKLGEVSEEVDAMIRAADITTDPVIKAKFIDISSKMLTALRTVPLHDTTNGGFYQLMYLVNSGDGSKAGAINGTKKEMRQASLLGTYNLANRLIGPQWKDMEREMYYLLIDSTKQNPRGMFLPNIEKTKGETLNKYRKSSAGYTFMLDDDWQLYTSNSVTQNWVSNESNSLILLGLYEFLTAKYKYNYNTDFLSALPTVKNESKNAIYVVGNNLYLKEPASKLSIYDMMGRNISEHENPSNSMNISTLKQGFYIAKVVFNNGEIDQIKFIK